MDAVYPTGPLVTTSDTYCTGIPYVYVHVLPILRDSLASVKVSSGSNTKAAD